MAIPNHPFDGKNEGPVAQLLGEYRHGMELEIHLKGITGDVFDSLYRKLSSDSKWKSSIEYSISVVTKERSNVSSIRRIYFENGEKTHEEYLRKTQLRDPPIYITDFVNYSIHLNREESVPPFKSDENAETRFRARVSLVSGPWRVDMSAIRRGVLRELAPMLKTLKSQLFPASVTPSTFLSMLPRQSIDSYEIEVEWIGTMSPTLTDFNIVKTLWGLMDPSYNEVMGLNSVLVSIGATILDHGNLSGFKQHPSLKSLVPQAVTLDAVKYGGIYPPVGWYTSEKLDGERCLCRLDNTLTVVLGSTFHTYSHINTAKTVTKGGVGTPVSPTSAPVPSPTTLSRYIASGGVDVSNQTLVDGEYMGDGASVHVFDVIWLSGEPVFQKPFSTRHTFISEVCKLLNDGCNKLRSTQGKAPPRFIPKVFLRLESAVPDDLARVFNTVYDESKSIDGIVLVDPQSDYLNTTTYKWKPPHHLTVDFLVRRLPTPLQGKLPYTPTNKSQVGYILFVGIDIDTSQRLGLRLIDGYDELFPDAGKFRLRPIQFSPSSDPHAYIFHGDDGLDGKIVEFRRESTTWIPVKIRNDRNVVPGQYYGNYFSVAESVLSNYINKFPLEALSRGTTGYFSKETADSIYKAPNAAKRYVIGGLFNEYLRGAHNVVDLCAGRGGDLGRYFNLGVQRVWCVDRDAAAITELTQRKFEFARKTDTGRGSKWKGKRGGDDDPSSVNTNTNTNTKYKPMGTSVYTSVIDLAQVTPDSFLETSKHMGFAENTVDAVVCNFALHYLCDSSEHLVGVLRIVQRLLKPGGVFIWSTMDGESVFKLLTPITTGSSWKVFEGEVTKYEIRKDYKDNRLANTSQMIAVRLPMTDQLYPEPLANISYIHNEAARMGLVGEVNMSFGEGLSGFATAKKYLSDRLTPDDINYISLHKYIVMRKNKS